MPQLQLDKKAICKITHYEPYIALHDIKNVKKDYKVTWESSNHK